MIDGRSGRDGIDIDAAAVTLGLRERRSVTTSRPSPADFAAVYRAALAGGASAVVSIHVSAALSGTWDSARLAAQDFGYGTVRVVDSRSAGMGLGFAVLAAARASAAGSTAAEVQDAAIATVDRTRVLFYVDTLEYLRRGGRIGSAAALLGTSLSVKPLLYVNDGRIVALERVRTSSKALARSAAAHGHLRRQRTGRPGRAAPGRAGAGGGAGRSAASGRPGAGRAIRVRGGCGGRCASGSRCRRHRGRAPRSSTLRGGGRVERRRQHVPGARS